MTIQERIMQDRTARGLKIVFHVPGRDDLVSYYPADENSKARWIADGKAQGWQVVEE